MADARSELLAALAKIDAENRSRKRRKKQRPQRPGGPRPSGPNANKGCGTGAGGFGKGNSCAKEDGRPNSPNMPKGFAQGGKSSKAASLPATKEALAAKAESLKQMANKAGAQHLSARKKAAIRKKEKQARDAAEWQAAADAAAKKRAAMLQKIRIKKANERLNVVEKPPGKFSGTGKDIQKNHGEIETEFAKRKYADDLNKFHSEADRIESEHLDLREKLHKRRDSIESAISAKESEMHAHFMSGGDAKESARMREELAAMRKDQVDAHKAIKDAEKDRDSKLHDLVGEFTDAHAGGRASLDADAAAGKFMSPGSERAKGMDKRIGDVWNWFSRVASPAHRDAFDSTSIRFRAGGGGSHNHLAKEITIGTDDTADGILKTTVHEYGHAIESRRPSTMNALAEDYMRRRGDFMASNPGSKILGLDGCDYYECVYKRGEFRKDLRGRLYEPSHLGYARRYSDAGYDAATRANHSNDRTGRYAGGTEVYSTGVESMYHEPSQFRRRARHGFDLTLLILSGRL